MGCDINPTLPRIELATCSDPGDPLSAPSWLPIREILSASPRVPIRAILCQHRRGYRSGRSSVGTVAGTDPSNPLSAPRGYRSERSYVGPVAGTDPSDPLSAPPRVPIRAILCRHCRGYRSERSYVGTVAGTDPSDPLAVGPGAGTDPSDPNSVGTAEGTDPSNPSSVGTAEGTDPSDPLSAPRRVLIRAILCRPRRGYPSERYSVAIPIKSAPLYLHRI